MDSEGDSVLVDVTGLPLDQLVVSTDSALTSSLRRALADLDRPQEVIAAFSNRPS